MVGSLAPGMSILHAKGADVVSVGLQMMVQEGGVKIWRPRQVCFLESRTSPTQSRCTLRCG